MKEDRKMAVEKVGDMANMVLGAVLLFSLAMTACYKRDPICREVSKYRVRFEIDSASALYMMPVNLERFQLSLYDIDTEKEVYKTFIGVEGGQLPSLHPGTYKMCVWSLNSDYTSVTYTDRFDILTAESGVIRETPVRVIVSPDHVFACSCEEWTVPYVTEEDDDVVFTIPLKSVCDSWRIEVEGVSGLENFSEATFFIYNQVRELYFKRWRRSGVAVNMSVGKVAGDIIVCEFGTFGIAEDGKVSVSVSIMARNGFVHEALIDVTDQVRDTGNVNHIIKISLDVRLNPLEQGGLLPSPDEWTENTDIIDLL